MGETRQSQAGGLSVQTLIISSAAAVVATVIVSQFWEPGTLLFTALVPIVVALTSELLKRPAEKITAVAPKVAPIVVPRRAPDGTLVREPEPEPEPEPVAEPEPRRGRPPRQDRNDPFGLYEPERRPLLDDRRVRLGLVTGLIAFVIGAAVITLSELTFGRAVGGSGQRTTLLGGSSSSAEEGREEREREEASPTATPDAADPQPTPSPPPGTTPTPSPSPSVTPGTTPTPTPTPGASPPPSPSPSPSP